MQKLYIVLAALHLVAIVITGILWAFIDVVPGSPLRAYRRDIRAVHFGSLYLVGILLGLAYGFDRLHVAPAQQLVFPLGLLGLLVFSSLGYLLPRPEGLDPFYYWTRGVPLVLAVIGMALLSLAMAWTAVVLVWYALAAG